MISPSRRDMGPNRSRSYRPLRAGARLALLRPDRLAGRKNSRRQANQDGGVPDDQHHRVLRTLGVRCASVSQPLGPRVVIARKPRAKAICKKMSDQGPPRIRPARAPNPSETSSSAARGPARSDRARRRRRPSPQPLSRRARERSRPARNTLTMNSPKTSRRTSLQPGGSWPIIDGRSTSSGASFAAYFAGCSTCSVDAGNLA